MQITEIGDKSMSSSVTKYESFWPVFSHKKKSCKFLSPLELRRPQASRNVSYLWFSTEVMLSCHLQMELALIPPANKWQSSPSFTSSTDPHCITYKCHCWSTILHPSPQKEWGVENFQREWWKAPGDTKACLVLHSTKPSVYQRVVKSWLNHNLEMHT